MATLQQSGVEDLSNKSREIRVALVLYGGVSLAIYENGVTRSFFDLVKGRGIFHVLLTLLNAEAKVDVVAGTSAGGINGLMLATALESGAEFKKTADLWREHGDFGALMRPVSKADDATSLLKGETYYQERLIEAFQELTQPVSGYDSPGEMDVFITGTDLHGYTKTYFDSSGNTIEDKVHRTLFQLKHRPGRKHLGLNGETKNSQLTALQATILASIARITSTFPVAFPPFQIEQVPAKHRKQVSQALQRNSGIFEGDRIYVDGGVLDNKPFGPAVKAIFYRMPTKPVDRRLFYVEPDPQQFTRVPTYKGKDTPNPALVLWSSLSTIPSHQSIAEDLDALLEHNARIGWLKGLKEEALNICRERKVCVAEDSLETEIYRTVRIDSLAKALLLEVDEVPSARHAVNPERDKLYEILKKVLAEGNDAARNQKQINSYDIDYHLRRAFYFLYHFYSEIENEATAEPAEHVLVTLAIGRVIKTLKLIRDALYLLRDEVVASYLEPNSESSPQQAEGIINLFRDFLDVRSAPWQELHEKLQEAATGPNLLSSLTGRKESPFNTEVLTRANQSARNEIRRLKNSDLKHFASADAGKSILVAIEDALMGALSTCCDTDATFSQFAAEDTIFFPLEFACGIHELDQIQVVRISPRDAKEGLGVDLESADKVTGDDLAHFAAFLRRDWRSNDILWGRLDGICQIIQSFMDKDALKKILHRKEELRQLISFDYLKRHLPDCPTHRLAELEKCWKDFLETAADLPGESEIPAAYQELWKKMILAGQHDAVNEDLRQVYFDHYFQEISWGTCCRELPSVPCERPPSSPGFRIKSLFSGCLRLFRIRKSQNSVGEDASANAITTAANMWADESMRHVEDAGEAFCKIGFGSQTVVGEYGAVPMHILSQYATQAYLLLWGVMHQAWGRPHGKDNPLGKTRLRLIFRHPAGLVNYLIRMMRREKVLFPVVFACVFTALIVAGLVGSFFVSYKWSLLVLFAIVLLLLFSWICPESE